MTTYHKKYPNHNMRAAWTLIELIFIMIVIGILASIAIGKLSTTRDDAELSADIANMNVCLRDMQNISNASNMNLEDINASSCAYVVCYTIDINKTTLKVKINSTAANYCLDVQKVGGHLANKYELAGATIQR